MREAEIELQIGGCVQFEYALTAGEALSGKGQELADVMNEL